MSDIEVELIECPTLPKTIQGDGRYVMSLLTAYLEQVSTQVNLANGFSAEEIDPDTNAYATPSNFYLSFDRTGGTFTWTHLADISNLAYYELRTDTNIGEEIGLLERTVNNSSTALPPNRVDTVYLYAVSLDAVAGTATELTYTKAYPDAPNDISVTSSSDGTLITFTAIPSDCIGANIYIGGEQYQSTSNIFLYTGTGEVDNVEVAYYDQFGEGERGYLSLVLPDVTGLLVERNGADLDFYWDPVNYYGVSYVVKVCSTSPDWAAGTELFRTKTNDKNRYIYPNTGEYYLMVKATDESGNYSKNAAWQIMNTTLEINRNIILTFDQEEVGYSGVKNNMYYDAGLGGVTLERDATQGEYIMDIELDQEYKARNWCDYRAISVSGDDTIWDDADYTWDEAETTSWAGVVGNADGVTISQQLAYYIGSDTETLFSALLDGDLLTANDEEPTVAINADDFEAGRWQQGLYINQMTQLEYSLSDMTKQFHMTFYLKTNAKLEDTNIITLADDSGTAYLNLGYNSSRGLFYLKASDAVTIWADDVTSKERDWICFGISQGSDTRTLYIYSWHNNNYVSASAEAEPAGTFTTLYCYPKIL